MTEHSRQLRARWLTTVSNVFHLIFAIEVRALAVHGEGAVLEGEWRARLQNSAPFLVIRANAEDDYSVGTTAPL